MNAFNHTLQDRLIVQEVAPRDGLQIEPTWVETDDKIALIDSLSTAGFRVTRMAGSESLIVFFFHARCYRQALAIL